MGKPIILGVESESKKIVELAGSGIGIEPGNAVSSQSPWPASPTTRSFRRAWVRTARVSLPPTTIVPFWHGGTWASCSKPAAGNSGAGEFS